ncbi:MAG: lamin tail domain-containing protein [Bacteroidota bacterium]
MKVNSILSGLLMAFLLCSMSLFAQNIVINEIHYNGLGSGTDVDEFIELVNTGSTAVDLSGWSFSQGVTFTFPSGSTIQPGQFIVVAFNSTAFQAAYGFLPDYQWTSGGLSNSGEDIIIVNAGGVTQDIVDYDDCCGWPTEADGDGPSLELISPSLDNNLPASWQASALDGGSPGQANGTGCDLALTINAPSCDTETIGNDTYTVTVDFTGAGSDTYTIVPNAGNLAASSDDPASMATGTLTFENIPEGTDLNFNITSTGGCDAPIRVTSPVCFPPIPVVINEIMYNPLESGADTTEYVELYNNSASTILLEGYSFAAGVTFTFPSGAAIDPGEYVVIAGNATAFENFYGCAPDYEWTSGALSNGGELILIETGTGAEVDRVSYDDGNGWPTAPDGDGPSLELIDPSLTNTDPASWEASAGQGTPGASNAGTATGCLPPAPGSFTMTSLSVATQLFPRVTWTSSNGADSYTVQLSIAGGAFVDRATVPATSSSFIDTAAVFGQSLTYRIQATNAGGTTLSNTLTVTPPAMIMPLELNFNCFDAVNNQLVWDVFNPNIQNIPFIWAQYWSPQRDTLTAPNRTTSEFRTVNNPQTGATPGDDNITGIWWIDENLTAGSPNDIIFSVNLNNTCSANRRANPQAPPAPEYVKQSTIYRQMISLATNVEDEVASTIKVGPNPFSNTIYIQTEELGGTSPVRVIDFTGKVIYQAEVQLGARVEIELPTLAKGIYLLEIGSGSTKYATKLIKE